MTTSQLQGLLFHSPQSIVCMQVCGYDVSVHEKTKHNALDINLSYEPN